MSNPSPVCADTAAEYPIAQPTSVEKWGAIEITFQGPSEGNPFAEVDFAATFRHKNRELFVPGFYDGDGVYKLRFMPDAEGEWTFRTRANRHDLDALEGSFVATAPSEGNRGPVIVSEERFFRYAEGGAFSNIGTTSYGWIHQGLEMCEQTLATLQESPFNKMRMLIFPKRYRYNVNEPEFYPFPVVREGREPEDNNGEKLAWEFDLETFVPEFFRNVDRRVRQLRDLGIEADVIVFHPYDWDWWCFDKLPSHIEDRYLRYITARLSAYRNVWWSLANEWDLMKKDVTDWERYARIIQENDPANHLRSIHHCVTQYDHSRPWITHVSYQGHPSDVKKLAEKFRKPAVDDECCYEGNLPEGWGNISGFELTMRFWLAFALGGYCGHSETYAHPEDILWWGKGGVLHGESPKRLQFLKGIIEEAGDGHFQPFKGPEHFVTLDDQTLIGFTYDHQPSRFEIELPAGGTYTAESIDPWAMTISPIDGTFSGKCIIPMPSKPYQAVRLKRQ